MSEVISSVGRIAPERVVVLSGPNLAREIAAGQPTATVLACSDHARAVAVQQACVSGYFRPYTITDVVGTEIAGTTKNVIALATGIAEGLGLGLNTSASLITRGLNEMARLGSGSVPVRRPSPDSPVSAIWWPPAPRRCPATALGVLLGQGRSVEEAQELTGTLAEGVVSCRSTRDLAHRHGIEVPITEAVFQVCHRHAPPEQMIRSLMDRPPTPE